MDRVKFIVGRIRVDRLKKWVTSGEKYMCKSKMAGRQDIHLFGTHEMAYSLSMCGLSYNMKYDVKDKKIRDSFMSGTLVISVDM